MKKFKDDSFKNFLKEFDGMIKRGFDVVTYSEFKMLEKRVERLEAKFAKLSKKGKLV